MAFMVATMAFVLAFPTLASAMTGYTSIVGAYILDRQNNWIGFDKFVQVLYTAHDGNRIGQANPFYVTDKATQSSDVRMYRD
jgi:hypothetical protein